MRFNGDARVGRPELRATTNEERRNQGRWFVLRTTKSEKDELHLLVVTVYRRRAEIGKF